MIEEADELQRMIETARPLDTTALALWPTLTVDAKQRALRLLIDGVAVKPAVPGLHPRQARERVGERLEIGWLR